MYFQGWCWSVRASGDQALAPQASRWRNGKPKKKNGLESTTHISYQHCVKPDHWFPFSFFVKNYSASLCLFNITLIPQMYPGARSGETSSRIKRTELKETGRLPDRWTVFSLLFDSWAQSFLVFCAFNRNSKRWRPETDFQEEKCFFDTFL